MKLSPQDYDTYYAALGIRDSDLLSTEAVSLAELPPEAAPSAADAHAILAMIEQWNRMDDRMKVDAAQASERLVLQARRTEQIRREAWIAFLMLGRLRDCEARREVMRRVGLGEFVPTPSRRRQKSPLSGITFGRAK